MPRKRDPERVTIATYTNKKKEERVSVLFARSFALKIATGDEESITKLVDAVAARIEREELRTDDE